MLMPMLRYRLNAVLRMYQSTFWTSARSKSSVHPVLIGWLLARRSGDDLPVPERRHTWHPKPRAAVHALRTVGRAGHGARLANRLM